MTLLVHLGEVGEGYFVLGIPIFHRRQAFQKNQFWVDVEAHLKGDPEYDNCYTTDDVLLYLVLKLRVITWSE